MVEREAMLFEAGDYPDKQISISEEDIAKLASDSADIPVKIEHADSVLDGVIGTLKQVWADGKRLLGKIQFTDEAWALISKAGAKCLSIGLSKDKSKILEVSLVKFPRIADARVFKADILEFNSGKIRELKMSIETNEIENLRKENQQLKQIAFEKEADAEIERFRRAGKLVPAVQEIAKAIFMQGKSAAINFDGKQSCFAEMFASFLEAMPAVVEFKELAKSADNSNQFSPEAQSFLAKLGVKPEDAAKYIN